MVYDPFPKRDNGSRRGSKPWNVLGERLNLNASDIDDIEFGIAMDADLRRVPREREVEEEKKVGEMSKSSQMTADSDKPFARTRGERLLTEGEMVNEPSLVSKHLFFLLILFPWGKQLIDDYFWCWDLPSLTTFAPLQILQTRPDLGISISLLSPIQSKLRRSVK